MTSTTDRPSRDPDADLERAWHLHHGYLEALAARVTYDRAAAEDIVQEAFTRFGRADRTAIEDTLGWLAVVVRRLALDRIRSAQARRETVTSATAWTALDADRAGSWGDADPLDRVTLDDQVRVALAVVLDRLSPAERTAFVLHDVFEVPFDAVGEVVGRSPAACRQLASRARRAIRADRADPEQDAPIDRRDVLAERFIAACATGDLDALLAVLDPDVVGEGGHVGQERRTQFSGRDMVGRRALFYLGPAPDRSLVPLPAEDGLCLAAMEADRVVAVVRALVSPAGLIDDIHTTVLASTPGPEGSR